MKLCIFYCTVLQQSFYENIEIENVIKDLRKSLFRYKSIIDIYIDINTK